MKHTTIYLVRHAHSTYTPDEYGRELSQKGLDDAKSVTELMKTRHVDVVLSSPYQRAIATVEGIAKGNDQQVNVIEDLKERVLAEKPVEDFAAAIEAVWSDESFSFEGGESNEAARQRGSDALFKILHTYEGKSVVIGTHGNIMVLLMSYFDSHYDVEFWRSLDMPDVYKLSFHGENLTEVERVWNPELKKVYL
ncbi:histidine phosphatase family protein [Guptibacillus algicola]|uniref:histidine phosphatase family protein n=1 Tax=Guptibacillus algicola TaxID=225844 RepID=UPI001CD4B311|nr:histidine phosphatase family protein [Alkalihalobacillus algicola]MCA0986904.1 histidine phosphatase family protein [Alkalihalobacillus algicola]